MTTLAIDFLSPAMRYRIRHATLKKEALARAIGIHPKDKPTILDGTAGLGRDSFMLASLGYTLTLLERSRPIYETLQTATHDAEQDPEMSPIVKRMTLIHADALTFLREHVFDVIYLDPMFPKRKKAAAVKKGMATLQTLLGEECDADLLLKLALTCARRRVVVKRPRTAPDLANLAPSFSLSGKSSRFDIYIVNQHEVSTV